MKRFRIFYGGLAGLAARSLLLACSEVAPYPLREGEPPCAQAGAPAVPAGVAFALFEVYILDRQQEDCLLHAPEIGVLHRIQITVGP